MKKQFYLLAAGLLFACITNAQIKKGDVLLGGNVGFSKQTISSASPYTNDQTAFSISPSIAKAVKDDLIVGVNLTYFHNREKQGGTPYVITTQDNYGLGFLVRKYKTLGAGFALFAEGDLSGLYELSNNYDIGDTKPPADKTYSINLGFYPGIAYFISRHVQLETGIQNLAYVQYGHTKMGQAPNEVKSNTFSLGTNLNQLLNNFVIGVKWVL
jgi:hypothetical protein